MKGKISGYLFVILVFIVFYVVPTLIDAFFDVQFADVYPEIQKALDNDNINLFYNIYISLILFFLTKYAKKESIGNNGLTFLRTTGDNLYKIYNKYKILSWALFLFPICVIVITGDFNYYSTYLDRYKVINVPESHIIINKLALIGVIIGAFILTSLFYQKSKKNKFSIHLQLLVFLLLIFYFWIHGKRSIVITFLSTFLALMMMTRAIPIKRLMNIALVLIFGFIGFMGLYGKGTEGSLDVVYKKLRIDFGRDYGVKFVMYNDLVLERHVVPSKFSSFIFTTTFFIPRDIWQDKPHPYAVYFTNSAFGNFGDNHFYGWGLTTSIISESISNIGFLGLFIGPYIIFLILKKERISTNPPFKLLSILVAILLLLLQIIAFMPIFLLYLYFLFKENKRRKIKYL
ncbi:O-antigen polysaccharide polymerase Wzy [Chryseobacterium indoltheticum]|nr:O-antigen polysaccharide polymerase Wzy [Chryseobacterium indoltheticum]